MLTNRKMKNILFKIILLLGVGLPFQTTIEAQVYNFANLKKNIIHTSFGVDFGFTTNVGYAQFFHLMDRKIALGIDLSIPTGRTLFDDYKIKLGSQFEIYNFHNFKALGRFYGNYRRVDNGGYLANSFGADIAMLFGYYSQKWHLAGELGFDKAIITHLRHDAWYIEQYRMAQTGWYHTTAGHLFIGLQTGYSMQKLPLDWRFKMGIYKTQSWKNSTLPFYGSLGINYKF